MKFKRKQVCRELQRRRDYAAYSRQHDDTGMISAVMPLPAIPASPIAIGNVKTKKLLGML